MCVFENDLFLLSVLLYVKYFTYSIIYQLYICPNLESNQGHEDLQSSALPTELSGQLFFLLLYKTCYFGCIIHVISKFVNIFTLQCNS